MPVFDTKVTIQEENDGFARFSIEPLAKGYGHTLGNALRRVLLSSMSGAAITRVKLDGVSHEFSSVQGVKEDVIELILNFKKVIFQYEKEDKKPTVVTIDAQGPGVVKASDLKCPAGVSVVNGDLEIANLADKNASLEGELFVEYGRGYRLPEENKKDEVGTIELDANFSPVRRVNYRVESTRVGKETDLDKLVLEVYSNGAVDPKDALKQSAAILVDHFSVISEGDEVEWLESETQKPQDESPAQKKVVYLEELDLPTRVLNTLRKSDIESAEDVMARGEEGLMEIKNVGPKIATSVFEKAKKALTERAEEE